MGFHLVHILDIGERLPHFFAEYEQFRRDEQNRYLISNSRLLASTSSLLANTNSAISSGRHVPAQYDTSSCMSPRSLALTAYPLP